MTDFEILINIFFPFAEEMLRKFGEFRPYAGAINNEGEVVSVGEFNYEQLPETENIISSLKDTLKKDKDHFKVGTIFYDVRTTDNVTGEITDAIAVFVEHKQGDYAYEFFYPYKLHDNEQFSINKSFGNKVLKEIF